MQFRCILVLIILAIFVSVGGSLYAAEDPQALLNAMLVDVYPQGVCGEEAFDAEYRLTAMGAEAFAALLDNIYNPNRSCRTSRVMGEYDDSLGAFCHALLIRHLEGESLTATPAMLHLNGVEPRHRVFAFLPRDMLAGWVRQRLGMSLHEMQIAAAQYAIELCQRENRFCTAAAWRQRLARLGVTDLPAVDPKEQDQGDFDRELFYYDPRTILDLIYQRRIESLAVMFPPGSPLALELGQLVIGRDQPKAMIAFRNWLDEHMQDLFPLRLKTAGPDYSVTAARAESPDPDRQDIYFEVHVNGGRDSFGHVCWQPFMLVPFRPRAFDSHVLFGLFVEQGRRVLPEGSGNAGD